MITKAVIVTMIVHVTVDETKFDESFMREFRESYYNFTTLNDHLEHLGQLYARGLVDDMSFIEGYGEASEMGIRFRTETQDQEVTP